MPTEAEEMIDVFRQIIAMQCPSERECEQAAGDEDYCFTVHPIHEGSSRDGQIMSVYMDLHEAVPLLLGAALRLAGDHLRMLGEEDSAVKALLVLANEVHWGGRC